MISWRESASVETYSSFSRNRYAENYTTGTGGNGTGSLFAFDQRSESATVNLHASTFRNYVFQSREQSFAFGNTTSSGTTLTDSFVHVTTWTNSYTSQSGSISVKNLTQQLGAAQESIGTIFRSTTRAKTSVETSTTKTHSFSLSATTSTTTTAPSWLISTLGESYTFFRSTSKSATGIRSTTQSAQTTNATTTTLTDTEYVALIYNTIYQAETARVNANNVREVLWCAKPPNSDQVAITPYKAAVDGATSTTRTTISAPTETMSIAATTRPSAFSLYRQSFTNPSITQSLTAATSQISTKTTPFAVYFYFPPETYTGGGASVYTVTPTTYQYTNMQEEVVVVEYSQSLTTSQWYSSAVAYSAVFPEITHTVTDSIWTSRTATTFTQNKYVTDDFVSGATSESGQTIAASATTSSSSSGEFGAGGGIVKNAQACTFGIAESLPPVFTNRIPRMTVFNPVGANVDGDTGFFASANVPFSSLYLEPAYTALNQKNVTTMFPSSWTAIGYSEGEEEQTPTITATISINGKSINYTTQTTETATQSGQAQFELIESSAYESSVVSSKIGAGDASWAAQIRAGAYKVIEAGQTTTKSTSGNIISSGNQSWWTPVSYFFPQNQTASAIVWTAPRNITNTSTV